MKKENLLFTIIITLTCIIFTNIKTSAHDTPTNSPCYSTLTLEMLLPSNINKEDVVSFQLLELGTVSSIYEIHTTDGNTIYQVLSSVALNSLPYIAEYACIAAIKNPAICKYVFLAGEVLINIFENQIKEEIQNYYAARVTGNKGFAYVVTDTFKEAKDGQLAFETSKKQTGYPWNNPTIDFIVNNYSRQ